MPCAEDCISRKFLLALTLFFSLRSSQFFPPVQKLGCKMQVRRAAPCRAQPCRRRPALLTKVSLLSPQFQILYDDNELAWEQLENRSTSRVRFESASLELRLANIEPEPGDRIMYMLPKVGWAWCTVLSKLMAGKLKDRFEGWVNVKPDDRQKCQVLVQPAGYGTSWTGPPPDALALGAGGGGNPNKRQRAAGGVSGSFSSDGGADGGAEAMI